MLWDIFFGGMLKSHNLIFVGVQDVMCERLNMYSDCMFLLFFRCDFKEFSLPPIIMVQ